MERSFSSLIQTLRQIDPDAGFEEIADWIGLAALLREEKTTVPPQINSLPSLPAIEEQHTPISETPELPTPLADQNAQNDSEQLQEPKSRRTELHTTSGTLSLGAGGNSLPFGTSGGRALPKPLEIARALRPLIRRVPAPNLPSTLDEELSIRRIFDSGIWLPMFRPQTRPWLELALVIDESPSMRIWHQTIRELRVLLSQLGAFRDLRTWRLRTDVPERGICLYAPGGKSLRHHKELLSPARDRLILIVSDCASPAWRGETLTAWLGEWGRKHPVGLLQILPDQRLWTRSALGQASRWAVSGQTAGMPNGSLRHRPLSVERSGLPTKGSDPMPPIPMTTLSPEKLKAWAGLVAATYTGEVPAFILRPTRTVVSAPTEASLDWEARYAAFQTNAKPLTRRLACLLAAAPLRLPVIRLIQQSLLRESDQTHLAEFFLSGLIQRVKPVGKDAADLNIRDAEDPELIDYDFLNPELRHRLLKAGLVTDAVDVQMLVGDYISQHLGGPNQFLAALNTGHVGGKLSVEASDDRFAYVTAEVMRWLGLSSEQSLIVDPANQTNNLGIGAIAQSGNAASNHAVVVGDNVTIEHHESAADHLHRLREYYLRRVLADCGELKLDAVDREVAVQGGKASLHLKAVYTALLTRTPRRMDDYALTLLNQAQQDEPPLSALEQLDRQKHLVLLGEPGSGKSTFVNFVALCHAGEGLNAADINLRYLTQSLPDEKGQDTNKPQPWSHGALLPLRVILRDFAARGLPQPGQAAQGPQLWAFVEAELQACDLAEFAPQLKQELRDHGGLVLLDGLDEVPEAEARRGQVKQAIEEFCKTYSLCRVLLTSRTYAYQQQGWQLSGFTQAELLPFGDGQIKRFIVRWYAHMAVLLRIKPEHAEGRAVLLRQAIFSQPRLRELAERPLLLTLMASLHAWRGGDLPDRRERLYAEAVDLLLYLWEQRRLTRDPQGNIELLQPSVAEYLGSDKEQVRKLLETLAYEAHAAQAGLTGTADIAEDRLVSQLLAIADNPDAKPKRLVEYLRDRAGLLTVRGVGVYSFNQRTFQEYLAACHMTRENYPYRIAELARSAPDRWREVALLAGAKAGSGTESAVWSLADELCYLSPQEHGTVADEWGALLAGQLLIESADLSSPSQANRAKLDQIRAWLVRALGSSGLVARERVLAGNLLASLGDPRPEVTELDIMQFCFVPPGAFVMGSGDDDKMAFDNEKPQQMCSISYGYWLARFPVTVAQFRYYLEHTSTQPGNPDCNKGPANHPVVRVSWHEAMAFCRWLTSRWQALGWLPDDWWVFLPSEAEWEKAARGGLEIPVKPLIKSLPLKNEPLTWQANDLPFRIYPWGASADPEKMNFDKTGILGISPVGSFSGGVSPYGNEEMSGNVWEWTRSIYERYPYPEQGEKRQQREDLKAEGLRVLRGGAFSGNQNHVRCTDRYFYDPGYRRSLNGFRVVLSPFF